MFLDFLQSYADFPTEWPLHRYGSQHNYGVIRNVLCSLLSDSSVLSGSHITTPLGLPESLGGLGKGQNSGGGVRAINLLMVQIPEPQEGHVCAFHDLDSQEREKGASTKGAGALLLGRTGCKC